MVNRKSFDQSSRYRFIEGVYDILKYKHKQFQNRSFLLLLVVVIIAIVLLLSLLFLGACGIRD